jgi:hypothetical protein
MNYDPLLHFYNSILLYWKELLTMFFLFVLSWELSFVVSGFIRDVVEFELNRLLKSYFRFREIKKYKRLKIK